MNKIIGLVKYAALVMPFAAFAQEPPAPYKDICDLFGLVLKVVNYFLIAAIILGALFIVIGAFQMITGGEEGKKTGKGKIWWAIIGIVIALLAWSIVAYIIPNFLGVNLADCQAI